MTPNIVPDTATTAVLHRKGFRATSQRMAIFRYTLGRRDHPTAQTIFKEVKRTQPGVSLATVYNTLRVLRELNLVQELASVTGKKRYDSYVKPHLNVICLQCGEISDVKARSACKMLLNTVAKVKFSVTAQCFDIYGICGKCKRRKNMLPCDQPLAKLT
jgi:Fur family peroxide stress response transcriptional regulator